MKISIVTVCFNNQDTIEDTIKSVLSQTYTNIEYIIIDGLSTDHTLDKVYRYQDQRMKIICEKDKGIYDALNKGIQLATGDVIGFLHADDVYAHDGVLEKVVDQLKEENIEAVYGDLVYVDRYDTSMIKRYWQAGAFHKNLLLRGWMPPHPTFFVKRKIYQQYGMFDLTYRISADYDLMMRFLWKHQIRVVYLPLMMIKMRLGGMSNRYLSNLIQKSKEDLFIIQKNRIRFSWIVLLMKNVSKIIQFLKKPCMKKGA